MKGLLAVLVLGLAVLTGCGGSSSSGLIGNKGALAGNWQFTLTKTAAPRTVTLISGFLQQTGKAVTGSVQLTPPVFTPPCGGSFAVSGISDGQNVNLTVNEGGATVTLTGTGSATSMGGSYNLVASGCGKSETGTFTATLIKPLNGTLQGVLHSTSNPSGGLAGGDFAITGLIAQSDNIGSSSGLLIGTLSAVNYPCFSDVTLSGTITGSSVQLNIIGPSGAVVGRIGGLSTGGAVTARPDGSGFFYFGTSTAVGYVMDKSNACTRLL